MKSIAVIILTFNEERHIVRALQSVTPIAQEIFIVDSFSTDRTIEFARKNGAKVVQHAFVTQSQQFQWALDNLRISAPWVMRLDADEVIEPELAAEICQELPALSEDVVGVNLRRKHIFLGRWIRHGGRYPLILLRIWRQGRGRVEARWMDEHMIVEGGRTITLKGNFQDHNLGDLSAFTEKHNRYATREAIEVLRQRWKFVGRDTGLSHTGTSMQASAKRLLKERVYNRLPFAVSCTTYFLWRYFFQLGFLDGIQGLLYHFLQGYWYRFLVGAKVVEYERALAGLKTREEKLRALSALTGFNLQGQGRTDCRQPGTPAGIAFAPVVVSDDHNS